MANDKLELVVYLRLRVPFWEAIKLRIAGANAVKEYLAEHLSLTTEEGEEWHDPDGN